MLVEASGGLASIPAGGPKWSIPLLKTGGSAWRDDRLVTDTARTDRPTPDVDVVVVGAGIAGLYLAYRLSRAGYRLRVFEAADDLGGTWYWNRYPGARVDVPSVDYMYSFDPDWQRDWQWSEKYATQPEILRYLNHVADKHDLRRHITFSTRVRQAGWDDDASLWRVRTDGGDEVTARFVVMATGCLSMPKQAEVDGLERFAGEVYFTSRWPHDPVDFTGKRVAVIGTGSSGVQSIPVIAQEARQVVVFQRTPNFSIPARNGPLSPEKLAQLARTRPNTARRRGCRSAAFRWSAASPRHSASRRLNANNAMSAHGRSASCSRRSTSTPTC